MRFLSRLLTCQFCGLAVVLRFIRTANVSQLNQSITTVNLILCLANCIKNRFVKNIKTSWSNIRINILSSCIQNVVAGTCLGLAGATATVGRIFDFCIVDEASMLTLPATIGPLLGAKKFVLVGDQRQLSPLVMSKLPKYFVIMVLL